MPKTTLYLLWWAVINHQVSNNPENFQHRLYEAPGEEQQGEYCNQSIGESSHIEDINEELPSNTNHDEIDESDADSRRCEEKEENEKTKESSNT